MSQNKKKRTKKYVGTQAPKWPSHFKDFEECVSWMKKCVYLIVRFRSTTVDGKAAVRYETLGTGFVGAPWKFITASHVINDPLGPEMKQHKEGDAYYLVKHDDEGRWHYRKWEPKLGIDIFLYPDIDLAVINLEKEFYRMGDQVFLEEDCFIRIDETFKNIGSEIGVLGYPLCRLNFQDWDIGKPMYGDILLRCDKGVVNCRYGTPNWSWIYEFTMAFNPGNSGGPIFDTRTGKLLSIVHGYNTHHINTREVLIDESMKKIIGIKNYSLQSYIDVVHASYSLGFATPSFMDVFKEHKIIR